jgi:hypothetical protein
MPFGGFGPTKLLTPQSGQSLAFQTIHAWEPAGMAAPHALLLQAATSRRERFSATKANSLIARQRKDNRVGEGFQTDKFLTRKEPSVHAASLPLCPASVGRSAWWASGAVSVYGFGRAHAAGNAGANSRNGSVCAPGGRLPDSTSRAIRTVLCDVARPRVGQAPGLRSVRRWSAGAKRREPQEVSGQETDGPRTAIARCGGPSA